MLANCGNTLSETSVALKAYKLCFNAELLLIFYG